MQTRGRWKIPASAWKAAGNVSKSWEKGAGFRTQVRNARIGKATGGRAENVFKNNKYILKNRVLAPNCDRQAASQQACFLSALLLSRGILH